ncbi:ParM/StbA family protein, partial [Natroniella sulfidigena]|uniref:ParM/StbA family protein n=1 Tax=Natroniella sulfidigena TaxID=723921 RepID=UPI00200B0690
KKKMLISVEDQDRWFDFGVGEYVANQLSSAGENYNPDKFKTPEELAKLLAGFSVLKPKADKIIVQDLVTGLPIKYFNKYKDAIKDRFQGEFKAKIDGKEVNYLFKNVAVIPQAVASIFYHMNQNSSFDFSSSMCPIIDIGGRTTDGVAYNYGDLIENSTFSLERGMSDVFKRVGKELVINEKVIREAVINGKDTVTYNQETINVSEPVNRECQKLADKIVEGVYNEWRDFIGNINSVFIVGGGAKILDHGDFLRNSFEKIKVNLISNAQEANAFGYRLRAEAINRKRSDKNE